MRKLLWYVCHMKYFDGIFTGQVRRCMVIAAEGMPIVCEIGSVNAASQYISVRVLGADKRARVNGSSWLQLSVYKTLPLSQRLFFKKLAKYVGARRGIFESRNAWYARVQYLSDRKMSKARGTK